MNLVSALGNISVVELRSIAATLDVGLPSTALRHDLIVVIAEYLLKHGVVHDILRHLDIKDRHVLDALIAENGHMMASLFEREFGSFTPPDPYSVGRRISASWQSSPVDVLSRHGLIYRGLGSLEDWSGELVFIPDELLKLMPQVAKTPFDQLLVAPRDLVQPMAHGDVIHDIGMLICYIERETVRAVHGDRLPKRDILLLNRDLTLQQDVSAARNEGDAVWITFVHHIARLLGLVVVQGGIVSASDKAEQWLQQTRDRQMRDAWRLFQKDGSWNDILLGVPRQFVYSYPGPQHIVATRSRVLAAVAQCPEGKWLTLNSLSQAMRAHSPTFLRSGRGQSAWSSWSATQFFGSWDDVEDGLIGYVLNSPLAWFGIVDVATSGHGDKPTAFRLTRLGTLLLGLAKAQIAEPANEPIVVQANFEIVSPHEIPAQVLYKLQQVAQLSKRDKASIYSLSQDAIWRHLQGGGDIERVIVFLETAAGRPLPQNVAYTLREWASKHGQLTIEQATLLTTASEALMSELRSSKKVALPLADSISPVTVTLREGEVAGLVQRLKSAGYWPRTGKGIPHGRDAATRAPSAISVKTSDVLHLLAAALVLSHIAKEEEGLQSPVSDRLIGSLTWQLPPQLVKQLERIARDAITQYNAQRGEQGDAQE